MSNNCVDGASVAKVSACSTYIDDGLTSCASKSSWNTVTVSGDLVCDRIEAREIKTRTPDVDPITKTELITKNGSLYVKHYKDGFFKNERKLMADIVDVRVYENTVVVMFADKTKTSAVMDAADTFSVEQGISICITKKLLGEDGSSLYNKLITRALKTIKKKQKADEDAAKKKSEEKKARELQMVRAQRRNAKKREEAISIRAEAIKRAFEGIIGGKLD